MRGACSLSLKKIARGLVVCCWVIVFYRRYLVPSLPNVRLDSRVEYAALTIYDFEPSFCDVSTPYPAFRGLQGTDHSSLSSSGLPYTLSTP